MVNTCGTYYRLRPFGNFGDVVEVFGAHEALIVEVEGETFIVLGHKPRVVVVDYEGYKYK